MTTLDLLTIAEASEILSESRATTARRVAKRQLPSIKLRGERQPHLLHRADVLALADRLSAERLLKAQRSVDTASAAKAEAAAS